MEARGLSLIADEFILHLVGGTGANGNRGEL